MTKFLKINFNLFLNLVVFLVFFLYKVYVEEDLIIGICSYIILFILFFVILELKKEIITQFKKNVELNFFIQSKNLKIITFLNFIIFLRNIRIKKRIFFKLFFFKINYIISILKIKNVFFYLRLIIIKIVTCNILINLVVQKEKQ